MPHGATPDPDPQPSPTPSPQASPEEHDGTAATGMATRRRERRRVGRRRASGGGTDTARLRPTAIGDGDPTGPEPTAEHDRTAQPVDAEEPPRLPFPVVALGASAGGLEAFNEFFHAMRPDSGMAFVVIQHLPPERESLLADLLGKRTHMPVRQIEDGMRVEPDHVYVIRPGHVLTIKDGVLRLGPPLGGARAADHPIDYFFKSLADEQRERAIGIVLSGAGSNGSVGAQAIKVVGGLCVAQTPETAAFPSMPRHLIDQGYADFVLAPREMPDLLLQYTGHPYARGGRTDAAEAVRRDQQAFADVLAVLRTRVKQDFSGYKRPTIFRRIQRRMGLNQVFDLPQYARTLRKNPNEVQALADDLLIHVTGFFRDPAAWESLRQRVVEPLVTNREGDATVRCWVTACSSGEEAYSLAILLAEAADAADKTLDVKIFATDMAERSLAHARAGTYPDAIETEVSAERLDRFFDKEDSAVPGEAGAAGHGGVRPAERPAGPAVQQARHRDLPETC
jgi:two-component system CheB/CheR fusion protein